MARKKHQSGYTLFQRHRGGFWYMQYTDPSTGERLKRTSGTVDRIRADEWAAREWDAAWGRKNLGEPVRWKFKELIEWNWTNFWSKKPFAKRETLDVALAPFMRVFGERIASDITKQEIRDYRNSREMQSVVGGKVIKAVKISTTNKELGLAKTAFKRAIEDDYYSKSPFETIKRISEKRFRRDRNASDEEQAYLFDRSKGTMHLVTRFALAQGMRKGEIENFKKSDIDLTNNEIRVESWKGGDLHVRYIPIFPDALAVLNSISHPFEYVFHNGRGEKIKKHGLIHSGWPRLCVTAGIENLTFHDLRHTFATELWRKTGDIILVHKILGHEKIETTMTYLNLKKTDIVRPSLSLIGQSRLIVVSPTSNEKENVSKIVESEASAVSSAG